MAQTDKAPSKPGGAADLAPPYAIDKTYQWNYDHAPQPPAGIEPAEVPGSWTFCGLPVCSPLGAAAGPLLNGRWCLYYAALGLDVVTYKTVRSKARECYELPNLAPVDCGQLTGEEGETRAAAEMRPSWAVSYGMPSQPPDVWRDDVRRTRDALPAHQRLSVSVVASVEPGDGLDQLAEDYARCARWAAEAGADCVEANFSCPNVSTCDGQLYQQPRDAGRVAARIREQLPDTPLAIKIGHLPDADAAAELIDSLAPTADALAMTNSVATRVRGLDGKLMFDGQLRGICGDACRDASLKQVHLFRSIADRRRAPLRIIGVGGVSTARHLRAYLDAGAESVHLATALMQRPDVALRIRSELS